MKVRRFIEHFFPFLAIKYDDIELLPILQYHSYYYESINLLNGYRQGEVNIYSDNDKMSKYEWELEQEIKAGRIKTSNG